MPTSIEDQHLQGPAKFGRGGLSVVSSWGEFPTDAQPTPYTGENTGHKDREPFGTTRGFEETRSRSAKDGEWNGWSHVATLRPQGRRSETVIAAWLGLSANDNCITEDHLPALRSILSRGESGNLLESEGGS